MPTLVIFSTLSYALQQQFFASASVLDEHIAGYFWHYKSKLLGSIELLSQDTRNKDNRCFERECESKR